MDDIKLMPEKYNREDKKNKQPFGFSSLGQIGHSFLLFVSKRSKAMLTIFIIFILISLGLWGYRLSLINKKEQLSQAIEELQTQRNLSLENDFREIKKGIGNFKELLANRVYASKLFSMLEELTLPSLSFTGFQADLIEGSLSLDAQAENYTALAKQILVFEKDDRINKVEVSSANIGQSGQVASDLIIKLNLSFLKGK